MSFNSIISNSHERFRVILESELLNKDIDPNALNELGRTNNAILDLILNNITNIDPILDEIVTPHEFSLFDVSQLTTIEDAFTTLSSRSILIKDLIENKFLNYRNRMQLLEEGLIAQKNKVFQKLAFLNHAANNYQKVFVEEFNNSEFINGLNTTLNIDKNGKVATLPISDSTVNSIQDIFITEISNGLSGSIDSSDNGNLWYTVDQNENTLFEYNKLDNGPCILGLKYTIAPAVINEIRIKIQLVNLTSKFKIKNIFFESSEFGSKSIKEICDIEKQNLTIDYFSYDKNIGFSIKFLPVKCSSITVEFEQPEYNNINIQQSNQISLRKVFTIAISEISFRTNTYSNEALLESKIFELGYGLKGCDYKLDVFPKNNAYYESNMILFEGNSSSGVNLSENKFNLLLSDSSNFNYKLFIKKLNEENNTNQIDSNFESLIETYYLNRYLDSANNQIIINDVFLKESVLVCRSDYMKRSRNKDKTIILNMNSSSSQFIENKYWNKVDIPEEILAIDDVEFYIGNQTDSTVLRVIEGSLMVQIGNNNFIGILPLKIWLPSITPTVIEKNNIIYAQVNEQIEPDKSKIKIYNLNNDQKINKQNIILNFNNPNLFYDLEKTYITKVISIVGSNEDFSNEILAGVYLNSVKGLVSFSTDLLSLIEQRTNGNGTIEIEYSYRESKEIITNDYNFWFKNNEIKGLAINSDNLYVNFIQESLSDDPLSNNPKKKFTLSEKEGLVVNSFTFNNQIFNGENFEIVDYINGNLEFETEKDCEDEIPDQEIDFDHPIIGFRINRNIKNENSKLITTYANTTDIRKKQFTIIVKNNICNGFIVETDAIMSSIAAELAIDLLNDSIPYNKYSVAIYSLESNTGIFYARRDDLVLRNARITYTYYTEGNNSNKISIDYNKGIIHLSKPITNYLDVVVKYKICNLLLDYSIGLKLDHTLNDSTVTYNAQINTSIAPLNKNIRLYYGKIKNNYDIKNVYSNYSPLIYSLRLGFN